MALLILVCVASLAAASTPVRVHYGEDATFLCPLSASARGKLVKVVNPYRAPVLYWAPNCAVSTSPYYRTRIRSSCEDASRVNFTLLRVTWPDEGAYTCVTSVDSDTSACEKNLTLVKVSPKVHIELSTPDTVATETGSKQLICVVSEAAPPVPQDGYSWSYLPSPQGQLQYLPEKTNTLTLGPVTREDSGQYFCKARNDPDKRWNIPPGMASFVFNMTYLGQIKSSPDLKVSKDDYVTLTCIVDSKPTARLAWVVEGREIRHVTANVDHYVLERAACSDSKTYRCRATNPDLPGLERTASTTLTVSCGQVEPNVWQTVAISLMMLVFVLGVVGLYLWHKRVCRSGNFQQVSTNASG